MKHSLRAGMGLHLAMGTVALTAIANVDAGGGTVFTHMTGANGTVTYNIATDEAHGIYTEPSTSYKFHLLFKQGDRNTSNPVLVATITPTTSQSYLGHGVVQFQIVDHTESGTPAYKADLALAHFSDPTHISVVPPAEDRFLGFAMKIDPTYYVLPTTTGPEGVIFSQWHQGSPYHPPVSLSIINPQAAAALGWPTGPNGNFSLVIRNDQHNPLNSLPGAPLAFNLGGVQTGVWMRWVTEVQGGVTSPGVVRVWLNDQLVASVTDQLVGFDPSNPEYSSQQFPPDSFWDYVTISMYRQMGMNHQRFFFAEAKLADSFAAASTSAASRSGPPTHPAPIPIS